MSVVKKSIVSETDDGSIGASVGGNSAVVNSLYMIQIIKKSVCDLVSSDKIELAFEKLDEFLSNNELNLTSFGKRYILIKREYSELRNNRLKNTIFFETYSILKNRIADNLLMLITDLDELSKNNEKPILHNPFMNQDITITLQGSLAAFTDENKIKFVNALAELANIDQAIISIKRIYWGSINIVLNMPVDAALKIYKLAKTGELDKLNVIDAKLFEYTDKQVSYKNTSYEEVGFKLGLNGNEVAKDKLIESIQKLYEKAKKDRISLNLEAEEHKNKQFNALNNVLKENLSKFTEQKNVLLQRLYLFEINKMINQSQSELSDSNQTSNFKNPIEKEIEKIEKNIESTNADIKELSNEMKNNFGTDNSQTSIIQESKKQEELHEIILNIEKGYAWGLAQSDIPSIIKQ